MLTAAEKGAFLEDGYLVAEGVVQGAHLASIQAAFDDVWEKEQTNGNCSQYKLLKYQPFIELIEHPPVLQRHRDFFGGQVQLLQYDLLRQGPHSDFAERRWHRDFAFPGERPLSINTILFLDDMTAEKGPTRVVPGSHRGEAGPSAEQHGKPHPDEVAVTCPAGSAAFINSAIWHTGGRNQSDGLRRGIYLYYGYWWLKRYDAAFALPWQAYENASEQRLQLLGIKMPGRDLHMYDPKQ
jgi:ectoine hydroxylase-related dioxygenase (phytanoyl-CoA dioxygenase family)